jgi:hypothetical protein
LVLEATHTWSVQEPLLMIHSHQTAILHPLLVQSNKLHDTFLLIVTLYDHVVYYRSFCYQTGEGGKAILCCFPNCRSSHGWTSGINNIGGKSGFGIGFDGCY